MKIVLTGGSGLLGKALTELDPSIIAPPREELNVLNKDAVLAYFTAHKPDIFIHGAAIQDNRLVEKLPGIAVESNIGGSLNVALGAIKTNCRLVYISTDYIYKGDRGNYKESDEILPFNLYAWSKLGGECAVRAAQNHLIIRTSFGPDVFSYPVAFTDKWVSKDIVSVIAPKILQAAKSTLTGVVNIGTERKTIFDYAKTKNPSVKGISLADASFNTPKDTSLDLGRWRELDEGPPTHRAVESCRVCGSKNLQKYLDLGVVPLANKLAKTSVEAREKDRYPLQLLFCNGCALTQLSYVVSPEILYKYYPYRSSISKTFIQHCRNMAETLVGKYDLKPNDLVVDIASNDAVLLKQFKELGMRVVGVDPAANLAAIANADGIETINAFWGAAAKDAILRQHGRAKLIVGTNVFAHVDDIKAFLEEAKECITKDGKIVIEVPYLFSLVDGNQFDTIYHEHLSYFLIKPLEMLARGQGLEVTDVERQNIHGGAVRVEFSWPTKGSKKAVQDCIKQEELGGFHSIERYMRWSVIIETIISDNGQKIYELRKGKHSVAAFGASAKGNTLLNAARINSDLIDYIVDDTPEKIGMFSPGSGIPIVSRTKLKAERPDYLMILAWNFKREILDNTKEYKDAGGKYIVPVPWFEVI